MRSLGCRRNAYLRALVGAPFIPTIAPTVYAFTPILLSDPLHNAVYEEIIPARILRVAEDYATEIKEITTNLENKSKIADLALNRVKTLKEKISELETVPADAPAWAKTLETRVRVNEERT